MHGKFFWRSKTRLTSVVLNDLKKVNKNRVGKRDVRARRHNSCSADSPQRCGTVGLANDYKRLTCLLLLFQSLDTCYIFMERKKKRMYIFIWSKEEALRRSVSGEASGDRVHLICWRHICSTLFRDYLDAFPGRRDR